MSPVKQDQLKSTVADLAYFGGDSAFDEPLHVGRPNIGNRQDFEERLADILDRRWLTNGGRYVTEFENRIAESVGVKHCVAMCNATVGLEIAIRALELTGEVIVPSFTFIASAHALKWQGITPVFCDIDRHTYNIDPARVEQLITPRTTALLPVHIFGRPCDVEALQEIAMRRGLKLLFDSAHAFGCSHGDGMIGGFGDVEVFSFHATKFINSMEGGAVVTNDTQLAGKMRLMKNFGFSYYDQTDYIGTNGKMNEVSAAFGLTNLESMQDFIDVNYRNYQQYAEELANIEGLSLITYNVENKCNYQYVILEVDEEKTRVTRDQLVELLHAENVLARRYFYPGCHRMEPYRSQYTGAGFTLPVTEQVSERVVALPTGTAVGPQEISAICEIVRWTITNGAEVNERFSATPL
jgi:dTDP-4-amino-4,6-dideoxygalactose transaminase